MSMSTSPPIFNYHVQELIKELKPKIKRIYEIENIELSHEELVQENLFQILEERGREMTKKEKDGIVMLLIEHGLVTENL